jgi:hypothetical protein
VGPRPVARKRLTAARLAASPVASVIAAEDGVGAAVEVVRRRLG